MQRVLTSTAPPAPAQGKECSAGVSQATLQPFCQLRPPLTCRPSHHFCLEPLPVTCSGLAARTAPMLPPGLTCAPLPSPLTGAEPELSVTMIYAVLRHVQVGTRSQLCPHLQPGLGCKFSSLLSSGLQVPAASLAPGSTNTEPTGRALMTGALLRCCQVLTLFSKHKAASTPSTAFQHAWRCTRTPSAASQRHTEDFQPQAPSF